MLDILGVNKYGIEKRDWLEESLKESQKLLNRLSPDKKEALDRDAQFQQAIKEQYEY